MPDGSMVRFRYDAFRRRLDKMVVAPEAVTMGGRMLAAAEGRELPPVRRERYLYDGAVLCGETFVVEPYAAGGGEEREATLGSMLLVALPGGDVDGAGDEEAESVAASTAGAEAAAAARAASISRVHVHVPGTLVPLLQHEGERGETFAVVVDHVGTPKELVGRGGTVAWAARHSAYARVLEVAVDSEYNGSDGNCPVSSPFRHLGQHFDADLGLCHTRYRWFDPDSAGWLSADPLGLAGGRNLFGFDGSPSWEVDPWGLSTCPPVRFVDARVVDRRTGRVLEGTVDLKPTTDRIAAGGSHPHRNDGSVFGNREGALPSHPRGYYTEYVHPTPGIAGPGPQRVVRGRNGELYYTPDHYRTFVPLN